MADDDSDIPPLEDMTDVLKQADAIREQLDKKGGEKVTNTAKTRAKVNKKPPTARSVPSTDKKDEPIAAPEKQVDIENGKDSNESHSVCDNAKSVSKPTKDTSGLFGGMKKGFLFGAPSNKSSSKSPSSSTQSSKKEEKDRKTSNEIPASVEKPKGEEIPYITPKGKTESGRTLDEVQQAMSEAKGLMDNQDWVTDDLLNKIEKNDYLIKRFSDPHFMTALQEFQVNPDAAMAKYKGNKEVEKFLTQFCGLLGDHFTNFGPSEENKTKNPTSHQKVASKVQVTKDKQAKPQTKIVEVEDDQNLMATSEKSSASENKGSANSSSPLDRLTNVNKLTTVSQQDHEIKTHNSESRADIQEMMSTPDNDIKEVLNDPKVMETLMDPEIMKLIQTLKDDPVKGQRIVDEANSDLRSKIQFLVSKGLLQFQTG